MELMNLIYGLLACTFHIVEGFICVYCQWMNHFQRGKHLNKDDPQILLKQNNYNTELSKNWKCRKHAWPSVPWTPVNCVLYFFVFFKCVKVSPGPLSKKYSSCSTIFIDDSTVSQPNLKSTIKWWECLSETQTHRAVLSKGPSLKTKSCYIRA